MHGAVDEVVEALRSAVRSLRAAERVLVTLDTTSPAIVEDEASSQPDDTNVSVEEKRLLEFIRASAKSLREYEEEDPQSFLSYYTPMTTSVLDSLLKGDMYQSGSEGSGFISLDNVTATTVFETCLQAMKDNGLDPVEMLSRCVDTPVVKHWGDIDADTDLVFFRYESPSSVEASMFEDGLGPLLDAAKSVPGAIDRCKSSLSDEGIDVKLYNSESGSIDTSINVDGISARWAACLSVTRLAEDIIGMLSVIDVDNSSSSVGWWDSARISRDIPDVMLSIVRSKDKSRIIHRSIVSDVEAWAASLPGWYSDDPCPVVFRNAVLDDILNKR